MRLMTYAELDERYVKPLGEKWADRILRRHKSMFRKYGAKRWFFYAMKESRR